MGRQSRPQTGKAQPQGRPMGAAFRAREFRRSASLFWDCEGFETDNLARQPAGMRRAATLPHGSTMHGEMTRTRFGETNLSAALPRSHTSTGLSCPANAGHPVITVWRLKDTMASTGSPAF